MIPKADAVLYVYVAKQFNLDQFSKRKLVKKMKFVNYLISLNIMREYLHN